MTEICPPCAAAADASTRLRGGHHPEICRDAAIQPHGCPCQHKRPHGGRAIAPVVNVVVQAGAALPRFPHTAMRPGRLL